MKILCICSQGRNRSQATRVALMERGYQAINAGIDVLDVPTIEYLAQWADKILLAELAWLPRLSSEAQQKVDPKFEIGPDIWLNVYNPEMIYKIKTLLDNIKF